MDGYGDTATLQLRDQVARSWIEPGGMAAAKTLMWVKGHSGVKGSEQADYEAKKEIIMGRFMHKLNIVTHRIHSPNKYMRHCSDRRGYLTTEYGNTGAESPRYGCSTHHTRECLEVVDEGGEAKGIANESF